MTRPGIEPRSSGTLANTLPARLIGINIVVKDYKGKIYRLIDMSIQSENSISVKEYNKINKFKNLEIEI